MNKTTSRFRRIGWGRAMTCGAVFVASAACSDPTGNESSDPARCEQTYEFGNYGCVRVVALLSVPDGPLSAHMKTHVRLRAMSGQDRWTETVLSEREIRMVTIQAQLMLAPLPHRVDTVSVWVVAQLRDLTQSSAPMVAIDSVRHLLRFAPVGALATVDTVSLQLKRP